MSYVKGVPLEIEAGCVELLSNLTPPQLLGLQLRVNQRFDPFNSLKSKVNRRLDPFFFDPWKI
jgi:hypothetical protein